MGVGCHVVRAALAISIATVGCRSATSDCPSLSAPAIVLTVIDSVAGGPPAARSTVVATTAGDHAETVMSGDVIPNVFYIGDARSGSFSLVVKTPGYADWSESGIAVNADHCGLPITVSLTAKLQR